MGEEKKPMTKFFLVRRFSSSKFFGGLTSESGLACFERLCGTVALLLPLLLHGQSVSQLFPGSIVWWIPCSYVGLSTWTVRVLSSRSLLLEKQGGDAQ